MSLKFTTLHYRLSACFYLLSVYGFGVFSKSAWSDDFSTLLTPDGTRLHAVRDGRILYGWSLDFLFSHFSTVQSLSLIKLIGLLGLILLNDLLIRKFRSSTSSKSVVIASTLAFTLPSFQFAAHWAMLFMTGWTAYFAVIGLQFFSRHSPAYKFFGLTLISASLLLYPLMSFFIFPYIYCLWLLEEASYSKLYAELRQGVILVFCASAASFFFFFGYLRLNNLTSNTRVALVTLDEIPEKIFFFFSRPFALTYRPFLINSPTTIETLFSVFLFVFILILILWHKTRSIKRTSVHILMFNIVIVFSLLPLLVVSENQIDLRFIASNTWLYVFVTSYLLFEQFGKVKFGSLVLQKTISTAMAGLLLTVGAATINFRFLVLYQNRFQEKEAFIGQQLSKCSNTDLSLGITIIERTIPWPKWQYIGAYSQHTDLESSWVPIAAVTQYLRDFNLPRSNAVIFGTHGKDSLGCEIILDEYPNK